MPTRLLIAKPNHVTSYNYDIKTIPLSQTNALNQTRNMSNAYVSKAPVTNTPNQASFKDRIRTHPPAGSHRVPATTIATSSSVSGVKQAGTRLSALLSWHREMALRAFRKQNK